MDQPYVYEEDEYEEGLTLKKIGNFLAKGWIRMLVYAAVLVAAVAIIVLPIKVYYKSEPVAQTSLEYIYDGVDEGLDPNGGALNTDNIISTTVLDSAVKAAELDGIITDISKLRASMRVEAVPTEEYLRLVQDAADGNTAAQDELREYTMYSTRFNIILSQPKELGLNDNQVMLLMDKVVAAYFENFRDRYTVSDMFSSDIYSMSSNDVIEFIDAYDAYKTALDSMNATLSALSGKAGTFVSTKTSTSFSLLKSELAVLDLSYGNFNNYILENNVWKNVSAATKTLSDNDVRLESEITAQEAYVNALQELITNIQPTTITSAVGGDVIKTTSYPEEYYKYQDLLSSAIAAKRALESADKNNEIRLNTITEFTAGGGTVNPENIAKAKEILVGIEAQSATFVNKLNDTISDYYETTVVSNAVRQVQPSVVTRRNSNLNVLMIFAIAAVAGVLIGGIVTGIKISKANAAAKKTVAEEPKEEPKEEQSGN